MRSKAVLTIVTVVAVTFLGACGENKSKKAAFRPRGGSKVVPAETPKDCPGVSPGGRGTPAQICADLRTALQSLTATNENCRAAILPKMQTTQGCEVTEADRKGTQELHTIGEVKNTAPNETTLIQSTNPKTTPETVANDPNAVQTTVVTDPQTGDITPQPAVPVSSTGITASDIAPVVASASTSVPSAAAGTTGTTATTPSTCSTEEKSDTASCEKFTRINLSASLFAKDLDFKTSSVVRQPTRWATFVCTQSAKQTAAKTVRSTIRKEIPTAINLETCKTGLSALAVSCSRAIKCGGTKTDVMNLSRLPSEPNGPQSDEAVATPAPTAD